MRTLGFTSDENINIDIFIEYGYLSNITEMTDSNAQMFDSLLLSGLNLGVISSAKDAFYLIIHYDTEENEKIFCGLVTLEKSTDKFLIRNIILEKRLFNKKCLTKIFTMIQNFLNRMIGRKSTRISYNNHYFNCQFDCNVNETATLMANVAMHEEMIDLQ